MDSEEQKLIDEIKDRLHNFEIPYEEGNWENFQKLYGKGLNEVGRKSGKALFPWRYVAAAAALIGALIYLPWHRSGTDETRDERVVGYSGDEQPREMPDLPMSDDTNVKIEDVPNIGDHRSEKRTVSRSVINKKVSIAGVSSGISLPQPLLPPTSVSFEEPAGLLSRNDNALAVRDQQEPGGSPSGKWRFGVEMNASFRTDRPNVAAGILAQFDVSEKVKLSTGLTYSHISAMHSTHPVQLSYDTRIIGGESTIKAIDIPLTIVYEPVERWYASVGVSALAVLDEHKIYRMESEILRESATVDPESGASVSVFEVVRNEYNQESIETDFKGRSNLRYLNLSIGRKQRVNRTDLLVEPFVKIPMGGLQRGDVNLLNSGVRIKVMF